jgi:hypothetical protein
MLPNKWLLFLLSALPVVVTDLLALPWANVVSPQVALYISAGGGALLTFLHLLMPPVDQQTITKSPSAGGLITHTSLAWLGALILGLSLVTLGGPFESASAAGLQVVSTPLAVNLSLLAWVTLWLAVALALAGLSALVWRRSIGQRRLLAVPLLGASLICAGCNAQNISNIVTEVQTITSETCSVVPTAISIADLLSGGSLTSASAIASAICSEVAKLAITPANLHRGHIGGFGAELAHPSRKMIWTPKPITVNGVLVTFQ